jgi:hypothetical protein
MIEGAPAAIGLLAVRIELLKLNISIPSWIASI